MIFLNAVEVKPGDAMVTYLSNEVNKRLCSELLDPWYVEAGQVEGLSLLLCLTTTIKSPILCKRKIKTSFIIILATVEQRDKSITEEEDTGLRVSSLLSLVKV